MPDRGASAASPSFVLEEGAVLAEKYKLERPAGFGGMAQLWVATNEATGAEVCIKILVPTSSDDDSVERFRREAYAAARLSHRAIVRIFDLVELGANGETMTTGKPTALAIVMELLHGETLGDYMMKKGKLSLDEAIDLTLPFLSALAHAHRAGVVHRDLKPDNIFLASDPDGHVIPKVLDFGVSKMSSGDRDLRSGDAKPLTVDGVMLGTPSFMSPEQARGARDIDARSDVFSAGILFYMMLAGKNPFESETFHSVVAAIIQREVLRIDALPDPIWTVLDKALSKDASARYADATELGIALRRASGRTSTTDSGPHSASSLPASVRKIVPPLGGDSVVTVPPVGNAELGDGPQEARARASEPAARRRAMRIVLGVVGVAVALLITALFRSPDRSTTSEAPPAISVPVTATATITAVPTVTVAATTTVAPTATMALAVADALDAGIVAAPKTPVTPPTATATATARKPSVLPPPGNPFEKKKDPAPVGTHKDPAIVRDPGF